ncbi:MAG: VCBS repeat-containing protein [Myxococcota bacterium]
MIFALLLLSAPTLVAVDGWVIATHAGASWTAPDRQEICARPKLELFPADDPKAAPRAVRCEADEEGALTLSPAPKSGSGTLELSAPLPARPREIKAQPLDSKIYRAVLKDHLGPKMPPPILQDLRRVDLDGDGSEEVLILGASRKPEDNSPKRPNDWAVAVVRFVDAASKQPRLLELIRHDHTGEQLGPATLRVIALADLDGDGHLEIILEDRDPWGVAMTTWRFDRGKLTKLSEVGVGE